MWRLNGVTLAMLRWNTIRVFSKPETHALLLLLTPTMFRILGVCFGMLVRLFRRRRNLFLEILALRRQLAALKRQGLAPVVRASIDKPALAKTLNLRPQQKIILAEWVGYQRSRSGCPLRFK
jgi:hypothetical protein